MIMIIMIVIYAGVSGRIRRRRGRESEGASGGRRVSQAAWGVVKNKSL